MEETVKVVITIQKKDLGKFIDKFGIEEYHYKNREISVDMTKLFDSAMSDLPAKSESAGSSSIDAF